MLERVHVVDLTRTIDHNLEIYADGAYRDPDFGVETWCTVESQGYWVSKLSLGTQTGTHIDAPAHFKSGGATLESLPAKYLLGPYFLIDLDRIHDSRQFEDVMEGYSGQLILLLTPTPGRTSHSVAELTLTQFHRLCALGAKVWAVVGSVHVQGEDPLYFHVQLAEQGIFLVEDLDQEAASEVRPGGELIALPLRLTGVSGSPCRVLVLQ